MGIRTTCQLKKCRQELWVANLEIKRLREHNDVNLSKEVLTIIRSGPITTSQIYDKLKHSFKIRNLQCVLVVLRKRGMIEYVNVTTAGRLTKMWSIEENK